jgi:hypothetical protein
MAFSTENIIRRYPAIRQIFGIKNRANGQQSLNPCQTSTNAVKISHSSKETMRGIAKNWDSGFALVHNGPKRVNCRNCERAEESGMNVIWRSSFSVPRSSLPYWDSLETLNCGPAKRYFFRLFAPFFAGAFAFFFKVGIFAGLAETDFLFAGIAAEDFLAGVSSLLSNHMCLHDLHVHHLVVSE